jgi:hypothetical protein
MTGQTDSARKTARHFLTRARVWVPGAIVALAIAVLIALPYGIRYGLQRQLLRAGAEQVVIGDIDFNPFLGYLAVHNLQLRVGGKSTLAATQASVRVALLPLLHRQVDVRDIYLRDAALSIERRDDGRWSFAGLPPGPPDAGQTPKQQPGWRLLLRHAEIHNADVQYLSAALDARARVNLAELDLVPGDMTVTAPTRLRLDGQLQIANHKPGVTAEARVYAEVTAAPPATASGTWNLSGRGSLHQVDVRWPDGALRVAAAGKLDVDDFAVGDGGAITVRALGLDRPAVAQSAAGETAPVTLSAAQLQAGAIRLVPGQTLTIDKVSARGLRVTGQRGKNGRWYGIAALQALQREFAAAAAPAAAGNKLAIRIGDITLDDPGLIELSDLGVQPPYRSRVTVTRAQLTGLDTGATPAQPAVLLLSVRLGKYGSAEVRGRIRAIEPRLQADITARLREFDLPGLSPYAVQMLGYRLVSGQLSDDSEIKITNGRIEGRNKFALANLSVAPRNEAAAEKMATRLAMPLESALAMLRDKNNNVNLEIHISGNLGDPKFDVTDAINQALTGAIRGASVTYLKYFFQPYGALITVAELAGKAMQLRLDPVTFAAGSAVLTAQTHDYLAKVGKLLQERQNLRVKLCGKAVPQDGLSGDAALALARQRAEALKDHFVKQYGIASDRLFLCDPEFAQDAAAGPRVDLAL